MAQRVTQASHDVEALQCGKVHPTLTSCKCMILGHSWQAQTDNEEPSHPPLRLEGPCPVRCFDFPLPPARKSGTLFGLRCGGGAASSAWPSGAFPQFGPPPNQLQLRQCPADICEDFSNDGTNINDWFTDGRIWDQASVRRCHMTVQDNEVVSFSLMAERRSWLRSRPPNLTGPQAICYLSKHA